MILGNNHAFRYDSISFMRKLILRRFNHPEEAQQLALERQLQAQQGKDEMVDWDFAFTELAAAQGKLLLSRAQFDHPKVIVEFLIWA